MVFRLEFGLSSTEPHSRPKYFCPVENPRTADDPAMPPAVRYVVVSAPLVGSPKSVPLPFDRTGGAYTPSAPLCTAPPSGVKLTATLQREVTPPPGPSVSPSKFS